MTRGWAAAAALALAGCGGEAAPAVRSAGYVPVPTIAAGGLTPTGGQSAAMLIARFGPPKIDVREGPARKLQFLGPACVLDAYLYPRGRGEPIVTHIDARRRDGSTIDPVSCMAALTHGAQPTRAP
ncbi:MAG: hypothetical protein WDN44_12770 [Sphingomonas sp.]